MTTVATLAAETSVTTMTRVSSNAIRPIAICLFSNNGRILAAEGYDSVRQETFYRPLGGTIEFGETGEQAIIREIEEELGAAVTDLRFLAAIENIFTYNGRPGHEIVLVYDGRFVDESLYEQLELQGYEHTDEDYFWALWLDVAAMQQPGAAPVYPDGVLNLAAG